MGFFDRLAGKKPAPPSPSAPSPVPPTPSAGGSTVGPRLAAAREKLAARDLAGAVAIYDEVLALAGERADVLVAISGDLGSAGHVAEIVELIAPRYDAQRHGPATGLNVLQAYLALRQTAPAQHVLDVLFGLARPELEERLHGFSNALAELIEAERRGQLPLPEAVGADPARRPTIALVSLSKPIWFYGLEPLAAALLPPKDRSVRRIAFAQLALPGAHPDLAAAIRLPEDELGRLSRALPLWLAEDFYFSPHYDPIAAIGLFDDPETGKHPALFGVEWTTENLRQLVDTAGQGIDYIVTGALSQRAADYELLLRVWEVKKFRERKTFTACWTPATADAELTKLLGQVRTFMEWAPETRGLAHAPPAQPRAWLDNLGASLAFFLSDKNLLPKDRLADPAGALARAAQSAAAGEAASLACLTLRARGARLGFAAPGELHLAKTPLVEQARQILG